MTTAYLYVLGSLVIACTAKVARLPVKGESLAATAFHLETGGKGFNLAFGAYRLGATVRGILPRGDDFLGDFAARSVAACGLSPDMTRIFPGQTGSGIGFTDAAGDNALAIFAGANALPRAGDIRKDAADIAGAALVLAQFELCDTAIAEGFSIARAAGVPTLLNPSPFRPIPADILSATSIILVNEIEAADLARDLGIAPAGTAAMWIEAAPNLADALRARGPEVLVVTLGDQGVVAVQEGCAPHYQPAFPVSALDALGAGDAFTAGFAVSLVEGRPFEDAVRRGAACGALAVTKFGVSDALPAEAEVEALMERCSRPG
ncbi:ribokinase [soil metagenome]